MSKKAKKRFKRRYVLSIASLVILSAMGIVALLALGDALEEVPPPIVQANVFYVNFYFRDADGHWGSEQRQFEEGDNTAIIEAVLQGLHAGPQTAAFSPSLPPDVRILGAVLDKSGPENILTINFSPEFNDIDPIEMIFATSSLVYTLTDLDFVDQLVFYVDEEPMLDGDGNYFGLRSRENTILAEITVIDTATVMLYFPDEQMLGLVGEPRTIEINPLVEDIEHFILEALIEGPRNPGLYAAIPPTIVYNMLERIGNDMIIIDFPRDFLDLLTSGGSTMEEMTVFSLVNTLTAARPETRRVQIFIDGQPILPDDAGGLHMDLSGPIERDEDLIIGYFGE